MNPTATCRKACRMPVNCRHVNCLMRAAHCRTRGNIRYSRIVCFGRISPGGNTASAACPSALFVTTIMDQQHSVSTLGRQEDDTGCFESPTDLIARAFVHLEAAFGFEALERGQ